MLSRRSLLGRCLSALGLAAVAPIAKMLPTEPTLPDGTLEPWRGFGRPQTYGYVRVRNGDDEPIRAGTLVGLDDTGEAHAIPANASWGDDLDPRQTVPGWTIKTPMPGHTTGTGYSVRVVRVPPSTDRALSAWGRA